MMSAAGKRLFLELDGDAFSSNVKASRMRSTGASEGLAVTRRPYPRRVRGSPAG